MNLIEKDHAIIFSIIILLSYIFIGFLFGFFFFSLFSKNQQKKRPNEKTTWDLSKEGMISAFFAQFSSFIVSLIGFNILIKKIDISENFFEMIGFSKINLLIFIPFLLTVILFLGPISFKYYDFRIFCEEKSITFSFSNFLLWIKEDPFCYLPKTKWKLIKNCVFAPLSEEFTFRSFLIVVFFLAKFNLNFCIFYSSLIFSLAHISFFLQNIFFKKVPIIPSIFELFFQMGYTFLFGIYTSYLFIKTHFLVPLFLIHSFCNFLGFPPLHRLFKHKNRFQIIIYAIFGCSLFAFLLPLLTSSKLYSNNFFE
ncbi:protease u48 caax prenyl protease rce1 [Anaeramoeba ignava]|uniref:intramembrane prenyl-peptidase Rce1 n=1 Tax=Anaeramoeba ignava TaxID=1746090 RepID=A0A9Q0L8C5_ANAIG|nr:protease u48 caax prenyl protease rce1 [Anaeramoeba ignava]